VISVNRRIVLAILLIGLLDGCASTDYRGNAWGNVPKGTEFIMRLTLREHDLKGSWTTTDGRSGLLSGTIKDPSTLLLQAEQTAPCAGQLSGAATIDQKHKIVTGRFSGQDCGGSPDISFFLYRQ
jgi:type IV pilus biogenesis protein CpaD/CtpE